jgi:tetratricopeptide (TPR) repeat protein
VTHRLPVAAFLLLLAAAGPCHAAAVIHLKNGATLEAESWEERGADLIVRQKGGTIVIPRSEIARIETAPAAAAPPDTPAPAAPAAPAPPAAPARTAPAGPAAGAPPPPPDGAAIERSIDELKRRLDRYPLARAEITRQLVGRLCDLGFLALRDKDHDGAIARFRDALQYDARSDAAQLGLAAAHFRRGEDIYARSILEQALRDHPDHPDMLALLGDVYYSQERLDEARDAWQRSHDRKPDAAVRKRLDKIARETAVDGDYLKSEAAHFTLRYDGERTGRDLSGQILAYLEEQFTDLVVRFDYLPPQPIVVVLYPQRAFHEATQAEASVAGLFDGKIRVPIGGLEQLRAEARRVLLHELTHAFVAGKSARTAPRWLHEGLAQHVEGTRTPSATAASLAREFRDLQDRGNWGEAFSYPSSLAFVEFLVEREGFHRLVEILEGMGEGLGEAAAVERATRYTLGELRDAWGKALMESHLH